MNSATTLCIDQLLRAAQLLEKNATFQLLNNNNNTGSPNGNEFSKLGEDYQERILSSKMRASFLDATANLVGGIGSTGSSRRSSPTSMLSNSSSAHSSSPNSPLHHHLISSTTPLSYHFPTTSSNAASGLNQAKAYQISRQSRAAHNELEKNRRANLRSYLDKLKVVLPADGDASRDTTLSLLTRARNYLRTLKEEKEALNARRNALLAEQIRLLNELNSEAPVQPMEAVAIPAPAHIESQPQQKPQISVPSFTELANSLCFTPPSLSLTPEAILGVKSAFSPVQPMMQEPQFKSAIDLYMAGLLPALPLLYPYTTSFQNIIQSSTITANSTF